YKANDGTADSNVATVTLTVSAVNDAPAAAKDSFSTAEDTSLTIAAAAGVLVNDTDVDGNALTALVVTPPAHGTLTLNANGGLTYTPNANFSGSDSFTYKANDGTADSNTATVTLTVTSVNHAPVAQDANMAAESGTPSTIVLAATDVDGNPLTYRIVSNPAHGTLSGAAPNLVDRKSVV